MGGSWVSWRCVEALRLLDEVTAEGVGDELAEGGLGGLAALTGVEDESVVGTELSECLAAGTAGHGGGVVEVGDGDGAKADGRAVLGDGAGDGRLLGAAGEAVGGVLNVAAGDDGTAGEQQRGADAEVTVGRVRVLGHRGGELAEAIEFGEGEWGGLVSRRHELTSVAGSARSGKTRGGTAREPEGERACGG